MTVGEANAVNELCSHVMGLASRDARNAAAMLADHAHKTLMAGFTGADVKKRWSMGAVMPADTALELLDALSKYSARIGRQCEVILRPDGSGDLMGAVTDYATGGEDPSAFESIADFDSLDELRDLLEAEVV